MGIYYEAGIVCGFYINRDDITEEISDEYWDTLISLDNYYDEEDYIWTIVELTKAIDYGRAKELPSIDNIFDFITPEEYEARLKEFWELFPNRKGETPKTYLYNRVS